MAAGIYTTSAAAVAGQYTYPASGEPEPIRGQGVQTAGCDDQSAEEAASANTSSASTRRPARRRCRAAVTAWARACRPITSSWIPSASPNAARSRRTRRASTSSDREAPDHVTDTLACPHAPECHAREKYDHATPTRAFTRRCRADVQRQPGGAAAAKADDTEVFFTPVGNGDEPNILFILDSSSSMANTVPAPGDDEEEKKPDWDPAKDWSDSDYGATATDCDPKKLYWVRPASAPTTCAGLPYIDVRLDSIEDANNKFVCKAALRRTHRCQTRLATSRRARWVSTTTPAAPSASAHGSRWPRPIAQPFTRNAWPTSGVHGIDHGIHQQAADQ